MNKELKNQYGRFECTGKRKNRYTLKTDVLEITINNDFLEKYSFELSTEITDYVENNIIKLVSSQDSLDAMIGIYNSEWRCSYELWNGLTIEEFFNQQNSDEVIVSSKERIEPDDLSKEEFIKRLSLSSLIFDFDEDDPYWSPVKVYLFIEDDFAESCLELNMNIDKTISSIGLTNYN